MRGCGLVLAFLVAGGFFLALLGALNAPPGSRSMPSSSSPATPKPEASEPQESRPRRRALDRDSLRDWATGKTPDEVLQHLGKPAYTQSLEGLGECWYYTGVRDPLTNRRGLAQLVFADGVVSAVNFP